MGSDSLLDSLWKGVQNAIPSGLGMLANAVVPGSGGFVSNIISETLGCDNDPKIIQERLENLSPEELSKLRQAQMTHKENLMKLALKNDEMRIQDVQNARQRETDIVKITGKKDWNLYILAWAIVGGYFIITAMMMLKPLPEGSIGPVNQLFGALTLGFGGVLNYFFGSSKSSSDKNKMIATMKM